MASLDPTQYPTPSESMLHLTPALGLTGDEYLDRETVAALAEAVRTGVFSLEEDWLPTIMATDEAVLEARFLERLRSPRLGPNAPMLHQRRFALFEAIRDLGSPGTVPGFGLSVHNITRSIGDVETWLEGRREELAAKGLEDDVLVRMLTLVPPSQLAPMLATNEVTLSRWRNENMGPRWAKIGKRTVAYPVIAVLDWLEERMVR